MSDAPFYEPLLARHFPNWGYKRTHARAMNVAMGQMLGTYRGADKIRTGTGWSSNQKSYPGGSMQDRQAMAAMADRAITVYQNNPIGRSLLDTETENVSPFTLQINTLSEDFNKEGEDRWNRFMERADRTGLRGGTEFQQMTWKQSRLIGDGGLLLTEDGDRESRLQYIPGTQITNPNGSPDSPSLYSGIAVDSGLQPTNFHVEVESEFGSPSWQTYSANDFIYIPHLEGPLDIRGVTCYGRLFPLLDQLDGYIDAVVVAARMAAIFGLIFKSADPTTAYNALQNMPPGALPTPLGAAAAGNAQQKAVTLDGAGLIKYIGQQDDVVQVHASQPMQQTPAFIQAIFRLICLGFDMPLEIGAKDLSTINFSGGRIGLLAFYRSCSFKQAKARRVWDRVYGWWLSRELKKGRFKNLPPGYTRNGPIPGHLHEWQAHEFHGREWDYTDPLTEAQADLLEESMGAQSSQGAAAKRGRNWKKIQADNAAARKIRKAAEIPQVLSNYTRDEFVKVTATDADGMPLPGGGKTTLNGVQITAAIDVLTKLAEKSLNQEAATIMLTRLGFDDKQAVNACEQALASEDFSPGDRDFQREILKSLLTVPAAREAIYNITDMEDLVRQTGLPAEKGAQAPYIPVVAAPGQLVNGAVIKDPDGDIVGGDVEPYPVAGEAPGQGSSNLDDTSNSTNQSDAKAELSDEDQKDANDAEDKSNSNE